MWRGSYWPWLFSSRSTASFSKNRATTGLIILLVLCSGGYAAESMSVSAGLVELKVPTAEKIDVVWESRDPVDLDFRTYVLPAESVFVFHAEAGRTYIVASDRIDWENHKFERTRWVIDVDGGQAPQPPPDDLDLSEFALEIQRLAPAGKTSQASDIAVNFETIARRIRAGSVANIAESFRLISAANRTTTTAPEWNAFGVRVGTELEKQRTLDDVAATMDEVAEALRML